MHFSYFKTDAEQLEIEYLMNHYVKSLTVEKKQLMQDVPEFPGVYLMRNGEDQIIYIGKSKNIKKRLQSYFIKSNQYHKKVMKMIVQVKKIDYIVTGTELEALLLESKLVKEKSPIYNKQLKNYKSYGYIKITHNEMYPRLSSVQSLKDDGDAYYGPYSNSQEIDLIVDALCVSLGIRHCHDHSNVLKSCIYHEIGDCIAPCIKEDCKIIYDQAVQQVKLFLEGKTKTPIRALEQKRDDYALNLKFEKAGELQKKIDCLIKFDKYCTSYIYDIEKRNMLLFLPSIADNSVAVLQILYGRIWKTSHYPIDALSKKVANVIKRDIHSGLLKAHSKADKRDVDEMIIIARWIKENPDYPYHINLNQNMDCFEGEFSIILEKIVSLSKLKSVDVQKILEKQFQIKEC